MDVSDEEIKRFADEQVKFIRDHMETLNNRIAAWQSQHCEAPEKNKELCMDQFIHEFVLYLEERLTASITEERLNSSPKMN